MNTAAAVIAFLKDNHNTAVLRYCSGYPIRICVVM
jgi:hypothetical protein